MRCAMLRTPAAFTLLELITVLVIIAILASMLLGVMASIQQRADKANCSGNLKSLYAGAVLYIQEHEHWPQINSRMIRENKKEYARLWYAAFEPYAIAPINWVCPSVQREFGNPDLKDPDNARIDYLSTPFDARPMTPYLWPKQPWFVERGAVHPGGNLIIFTNGQISTLTEAFPGQP
jgi:prepilin-type N-terminal cleavage/methylation domain-containing protein